MAMAPAKKTSPTKPTSAQPRKPSTAVKPALAAIKSSQDAANAVEEGSGKSAVLRLRELVGRVSENYGHKKKDVKEIIEATFAEMAKALDNNENMMLPSLGKVRIVRQGDLATGVPMTLKLRRSNPNVSVVGAVGKETLADDGEDS